MNNTYLPGEIQDRIRELMYENDVTQEQLAADLDISPSKLSRFLHRKTDAIEYWLLIRMSEYFHVSTDFLLGLNNDKLPLDYEVSYLGLSAVAVRRLINGEVDPGVISQLIEHKSAGEITHGIRMLQDDLVKDSLDAAACLTSQVITSAIADGAIEDTPKVESMRREAKSCVFDTEEQLITETRIHKLSTELVNDLISQEVYLHDRDSFISRYELQTAYNEARAETYVGLVKARRIPVLFKLWVHLFDVLDAPMSIRCPLQKAYYELREK